MADYLERKAGEVTPDAIPQRLAEIALDMLILQSEKNRLQHLLFVTQADS